MTTDEMNEILNLCTRGVNVVSRQRSIEIEQALANGQMTVADLRREIEAAEAKLAERH